MRALVVLSLCMVAYSSAEFVEQVRQNYQTDINNLLVSQITKELSASYIYQAYASYFQRADVSLPGIQKFFSEASKEERDHAQMLIDYVNKRGGHAEFDQIDLKSSCEGVIKFEGPRDTPNNTRMCICTFVTKDFRQCDDRDSWKAGLMAFEDALVTERYVNSLLLHIHKKADEAKDAHLTHILEHHFLEEQVNSINELAHYVTRLRSFSDSNYKLGEYIFDQNMK